MAEKGKRGGARPGAGRKKGGHNRVTEEAIAKGNDGLSPVDYLLSVMRDEGKTESVRIDAAKAVAPYTNHKLSAIEHTGPEGEALSISVAFVAAPDA